MAKQSELIRTGAALKAKLEEKARQKAEEDGVEKYSHREYLNFLVDTLPETKNDRLFNVFHKLLNSTSMVIGNPDLNGYLVEIVDLFRTIVTGSYNNIDKFKGYIPELTALVEKMAEKFPQEKK